MSDKKTLKPATKKVKDDVLKDNLNEIELEDLQVEEIDYDDLEDDCEIIETEIILPNKDIKEDEKEDEKILSTPEKTKKDMLKKLSSEVDKHLEETTKGFEEVINEANNTRNEIENLIKETQQAQADDLPQFENEEEARLFIKNFKKFLQSKKFDEECEKYSKLHKVEKKRVAETFSQRALANIGNALNIAIEVTYDATMFLINLLSNILKAACGIICSIANRLVGFLTLGYTVTSNC